MEKKFAIMPDLTCDLSDEYQKEYGIDVIMGHYVTPDGVEHDSALNWKNINKEEFFKELKKNPNGFKSAPPSIGECYRAFVEHIKKGEDIIAMTISSTLSGTYQFMVNAKEMALKEYPNAKIEVVDSRRFGPGFGLMALYAAKLRNEGKSFEEVVNWLHENKNRFHQSGWMDDLSFVAKKGRLTHAKAFFGSLVGIKPCGEFDYNGLTTVIGKAKGEEQAYKVLIKYIQEHIENPEEQIIFVATSNRDKQAETFKKLLLENIKVKDVRVNETFVNVSINIGPGLMAAYYLGKPITEGLKEETESFARILQEVK